MVKVKIMEEKNGSCKIINGIPHLTSRCLSRISYTLLFISVITSTDGSEGHQHPSPSHSAAAPYKQDEQGQKNGTSLPTAPGLASKA